MKKNIYNIIYIVITIILITLIAIFGMNYYNSKQLENEVKKIKEIDINNYKYEPKTITYFEYKKVEVAIKEYMRDYSNYIKKVNSIINEEKVKNVLSISNLEKDGKDFNKSIPLLNSKKKELEAATNKLYELNSEKKILEYIEQKNVSKKYQDLYKKYMFNKTDLEKNKEAIKQLNEKANNILDTDLQVLDLLKNNKDSWKLEEGKIGFYSNNVINQYNELVNKLK